MNESFLHYLWKFRLLDCHQLITDDGQTVEILNPGLHNFDAGPDFLHARLRLDKMLWVGNVEIHLKGSDWQRHNHQCDPAYDSCILHVVLNNDAPAVTSSGKTLPAVQIKNRFDLKLWDNYSELISSIDWIPCSKKISQVESVNLQQLIEKRATERLELKANSILEMFRINHNDYEETLKHFLFRNFGFTVNNLPFEMLSRVVPVNLISMLSNNLADVEALLFGSAGLLMEVSAEEGVKEMQKRWQFIQTKHSLKEMNPAIWKYSRMRPSNFPDLRIAQLALLFYRNPRLYSVITANADYNNLTSVFDLTLIDFWDHHYSLRKSSGYHRKHFGISSCENVFINTIAPFFAALSMHFSERHFMEKAIDLLTSCKAEDNTVIRQWSNHDIMCKTAFESQGLLHLKQYHCDLKKCLSCSVGNKMINKI